MVKEFKIVVDKPGAQADSAPGSDSVFYSGSEVTGKVVVRVDEPQSYEDIKVSLKGKGRVHWTEERIVTDTAEDGTQTQRTETIEFESKKVFVDAKIELWDKDKSPDRCLPPGEHSFQFSFSLPAHSPSSFEGEHGTIKYSLKAKIDGHEDHKTKAKVKVAEVVDINTAALNKPVRLEKEKTICCLCCASGPITTNVELPRTGYCIGENVPLEVTVENGSSRNLTITARLLENVTFSAEGRVRYGQTVTHVDLRSQQIGPNATYSWTPEEHKFLVSPTNPVIIDVGIIKREFTLRVAVDIPDAIDSVFTIPVTIGNVPFRQDS